MAGTVELLIVGVYLGQLLGLCKRRWLFGGEVEVVSEGGRVHEHVCDLMHLLEVSTDGCLLCLICNCHLHELSVDLVVVYVFRDAFSSHIFYFFSCFFSQLGLEFFTLSGVDRLVLEDNFWMFIDSYSFQRMLSEGLLQ